MQCKDWKKQVGHHREAPWLYLYTRSCSQAQQPHAWGISKQLFYFKLLFINICSALYCFNFCFFNALHYKPMQAYSKIRVQCDLLPSNHDFNFSVLSLWLWSSCQFSTMKSWYDFIHHEKQRKSLVYSIMMWALSPFANGCSLSSLRRSWISKVPNSETDRTLIDSF